MYSGKILIENSKNNVSEEVAINDLRNSSHPEYGPLFYKDVQQHLNQAIAQNGLSASNSDIYDYVENTKNDLVELASIEHFYHLLGQAKGILKYRLKHGKSSFNRYQNHSYETLEALKKRGLFKIEGKIYWAINGAARLELIHSVNKLCMDIDNPSVLEAGCGSGLNIYLLNKLNSKIDIHGFEYTNARLASSLTNLWDSTFKNNLFLADICDLNMEDNSYDVVYTNHVLEQLGQEKAELALKEIWRVCKKGIVVCEPSIHGANLYEKWRMKTLGYCEDLRVIANSFEDAEILTYKVDDIRYYPNTSYHLIVKKN